MHLHRIRREIGEPGEFALDAMVERQHAVGIGGVDHPPCPPVGADPRPVAGPAEGIGGLAGVDDAEAQPPAVRPGDAEIEPLEEVGLAVLDDLEVDAVAVDGDDADVAAVEGGVDADGHEACLTGRGCSAKMRVGAVTAP
jgi:hypothetical protein